MIAHAGKTLFEARDVPRDELRLSQDHSPAFDLILIGLRPAVVDASGDGEAGHDRSPGWR